MVVSDSLYANHLFLAVFPAVQHAYALVRLRSNLVFYERPQPHVKGKKGAPAKHGAKFKLSRPATPPDRTETILLGEQTVKLAAWQGLHFQKLSAFVGLLLRVEFLRPGWHAALPTTDVAVLDGFRHNSLSGSLSDVSLAFCDRAFLPLCQTAPGLERQPVHRSGQYRPVDVAVRPGVLANAAHAG